MAVALFASPFSRERVRVEGSHLNDAAIPIPLTSILSPSEGRGG